jgi:hypothetical protein
LKHTRKHERKEGGIFEPRNKAARHWRTVRLGGADCPHVYGGLSEKANRTSSSDPWKNGLSAGGRGLSACPRTVRASAADCPKPRPTKTRKQNGSKTKTSKNTTNTRRTALAANRPPQARGPSAPHGQRQKLLDPEGQLPQLITGSPKR